MSFTYLFSERSLQVLIERSEQLCMFFQRSKGIVIPLNLSFRSSKGCNLTLGYEAAFYQSQQWDFAESLQPALLPHGAAGQGSACCNFVRLDGHFAFAGPCNSKEYEAEGVTVGIDVKYQESDCRNQLFLIYSSPFTWPSKVKLCLAECHQGTDADVSGSENFEKTAGQLGHCQSDQCQRGHFVHFGRWGMIYVFGLQGCILNHTWPVW